MVKIDSRDYYYYVKELQKWEQKERDEGSNYVTQTYIKKYNAILDNLNPTPENPKLKLEPPKTDEEREKEYQEVIKKRVKSLKRKIDSGKGGWQDVFLFDVYSGKPKKEWRLPL